MKKKLKNLKTKIDENRDLIAAGLYLVGAAALSVTLTVLVKSVMDDFNEAAKEEKETLEDAIYQGDTIWINSDMSRWITFKPEMEIIKY